MLVLIGGVGTALSYAMRVPDLLISIETMVLFVELLMVATYVLTMENSLPDARYAVRRLLTGDLSMWFWIGVVVLGLIVPLLLELLGVPVATVLASVFVLIGGFSLRYSFLYAGARALLPGEARAAAMLR